MSGPSPATADAAPCGLALKEWGVVCEALARGGQSVLIRKGGISEGRDGFRFEHDRFWLFPTRFHATADQLTPAGAALLHHAVPPPPGEVLLDLWCRTRRVFRIAEADRLAALDGVHILSRETVRSRFDYREPGLFVAVVDVARADRTQRIVDAPRFAGCHSWVDLDAPQECAGRWLTDPERTARLADELAARLGD